MRQQRAIACIFVDVGGVLLSDGWDHLARHRAARHFGLPWAELEQRHALMFETFEEGRLTLRQYLDRLVFHRSRPFTRAEFRRFMFAQSTAFPKMIELVAALKFRDGLKVAVVSNEARELNAFRIRRFGLGRFVDFFVSSCLVHRRKPDARIFRLALDLAQVQPRQVLYIENTAMFADVAAGLGIRSLLHTGYGTTRAALHKLGLGAA
jgi:putative hydrolase of the HAD superfamily